MNTYLNKFLLAGASFLMASAFVACDNISEEDRFIKLDEINIEEIECPRVVLIEDFTGQMCSNCPDAHEIIEKLEEQYGESVVAVSIHGGKLALNRDYTKFGTLVGLANSEGEYYNTKFQIPSWPKGIINRNGQILEYADWSGVVRTELARPTDLAIELNADLLAKTDETSGEITKSIAIDVELLPQADIEGALQVWVLESGIVARQTTLSGVNQDYVHNNVLRAAVNGNDGEPVSLKKDMPHSVSYSIDVRYNDKERWNEENLSVVAFVYAADGVHQVAKTKVK